MCNEISERLMKFSSYYFQFVYRFIFKTLQLNKQCVCVVNLIAIIIQNMQSETGKRRPRIFVRMSSYLLSETILNILSAGVA